MIRWLPLLIALSQPSLAHGQCQQTLAKFFESLSAAAEHGDTERYAASFRSDASMFLPHRPPLVGREAIATWFTDFRDAVVLVLDQYEQESVELTGNVAMVRSRGAGRYLVKATNEQVPFDQKYLDILQCESGVWQMAHHVASSTTGLPGLWDRELGDDYSEPSPELTSAASDSSAGPREIFDLGALITEDLHQRLWGKAALEQNGFTEPNSFRVLSWTQELPGGTVSGSNSYYTLFNHGGPHVDAPNHIGLQGGLDAYPIEAFAGQAKVFDVTRFPPGRSIDRAFFIDKGISAGDVVLMYTGYEPPVADDDLPTIITLTRDAAEYLASIPVGAIGTDALSLYDWQDARPVEAKTALGKAAPSHEAFLTKRIPIYETLFNVDRLLGKEHLYFVGVPLNIKDGDGMMVRPVVLRY